jgi:hypothetical protein
MEGRAAASVVVLDCTEKVHVIKITAERAINQLGQPWFWNVTFMKHLSRAPG